MLPRLEVVRRLRPVSLLNPGAHRLEAPGTASTTPLPRPAPYAAVVVDLARPGPVTLRLTSGDVRLSVSFDAGTLRCGLSVTDGAATTTHTSRRHGRCAVTPDAVALTLTGLHLTVLTREDGAWLARGRVDLTDRVDTHDEAWLAGLVADHRSDDGVAAALSLGAFGQLGLRDLRLVSDASGEPLWDGRSLLLSATSAGPGFFDTAHTSLWRLDVDTYDLRHTGDVYFRRHDRPGVYGDHATHVVRDGGEWLVATSTWGDFGHRPARGRDTRTVGVTLARTRAHVLRGEHVLDTVPLDLPTEGFTSVGVWDPHLVRDGDRWLVGYASARRFFSFHPVVAAGPSLDALRVLGAAADRRATEGTTLLRVGDEWRVLASDGRDGRRGQRQGFPVFDLALAEVGRLDAPYPTNLPWPTLARVDDGWLMVAFNGRPVTGPLAGYGTHGDVVIMRGADYPSR